MLWGVVPMVLAVLRRGPCVVLRWLGRLPGSRCVPRIARSLRFVPRVRSGARFLGLSRTECGERRARLRHVGNLVPGLTGGPDGLTLGWVACLGCHRASLRSGRAWGTRHTGPTLTAW